ncbi:uncharacterized protein LOC106661898 [Cimex lectularius]|uniref:Kinin n=1 Tax=Cimex lectularius TaxID=79782 RepID=A0A8I6RER8_CIMLE|nr:uncharacterized protein LOC106661898 [Cimex lectularius]
MLMLLCLLWLAISCDTIRCDDVASSRPSKSIEMAEKNRTVVPGRDKRGASGLDEILEELQSKRDSPGPKMRFSSWGGKRSEDLLDEEEKRSKFSSWGGKRKFSSWGGKRLPADYEEGKKRAKFNSWGGKRVKFNSWGGKRSDPEEDKISKFTSWGEKLSDEDDDVEYVDQDKRSTFNSWGGKREDETWRDMIKRTKFNSWGGKRAINSTADMLIFKRANPNSSWKRKPIFSSWGGKRTARSAQPFRLLPNTLLKEHSWGSLLRPIRRGPDFYAWGGKRST